MTNNVQKGIYQSYLGHYIIVLDTAISDCGPVAIVSRLIEYGNSLREIIPFNEFYEDVSNNEYNVTGQTYRYQRVSSLEMNPLSNFDTESLIKELASREDSPIQNLGIKNLSDLVFSVDYVYGEKFFETEDNPKGVSTIAVFDTEEEAKEYFLKHFSNNHGIFKRVFVNI